MTKHMQARREFEQRVIDIASAEPEFRKQLLSDPREAIKSRLGLEFHPDSNPRVIEDTPQAPVLVLPFDPEGENRELEDAELDAVAGGATLGVLFDVSGDTSK